MDISRLEQKTLIEYDEISKIENNNSELKPISNLTEINDFLNLKLKNKMKILYSNKNKVHNILYQEEETIKINSDIMQNYFSNYFYLIQLIEDNPNIINNEYSLDLIKNINNQIKNGKNEELRNIIIYKIITELIRNYKGTYEYDEDENVELEEIERNIIRDINLQESEELKDLKLNINEIKGKKIDEICIEIINMLIRTNKIDNYEYTYNIIKGLDFENIDITKTMFDKLSKALNNEEYINKYKIIDESNVRLNKEIINFSYILFKYILKSTIKKK